MMEMIYWLGDQAGGSWLPTENRIDIWTSENAVNTLSVCLQLLTLRVGPPTYRPIGQMIDINRNTYYLVESRRTKHILNDLLQFYRNYLSLGLIDRDHWVWEDCEMSSVQERDGSCLPWPVVRYVRYCWYFLLPCSFAPAHSPACRLGVWREGKVGNISSLVLISPPVISFQNAVHTFSN